MDMNLICNLDVSMPGQVIEDEDDDDDNDFVGGGDVVVGGVKIWEFWKRQFLQPGTCECRRDMRWNTQEGK